MGLFPMAHATDTYDNCPRQGSLVSVDQLPPDGGAFVTHFRTTGNSASWDFHGERDSSKPTSVISSTLYLVENGKLVGLTDGMNFGANFYGEHGYARVSVLDTVALSVGERRTTYHGSQCGWGGHTIFGPWKNGAEFVLVTISVGRQGENGWSGLDIGNGTEQFLWNYTTTNAGVIRSLDLDGTVADVGGGALFWAGQGLAVGGSLSIPIQQGFYGHFPDIDQGGLINTNIGLREFVDPQGRSHFDCNLIVNYIGRIPSAPCARNQPGLAQAFVGPPGTYSLRHYGTLQYVSDIPVIADWVDAPLPPGITY